MVSRGVEMASPLTKKVKLATDKDAFVDAHPDLLGQILKDLDKYQISKNDQVFHHQNTSLAGVSMMKKS